jgi:hypothetical protein
MGDWRRLRNGELHNLNSSPNTMPVTVAEQSKAFVVLDRSKNWNRGFATSYRYGYM